MKKHNILGVIFRNFGWFITIFVVVFFCLYFITSYFNIAPADFMNLGNELTSSNDVGGLDRVPVKINIPSISISQNVYNPESQDVSVLDEFLKKGVVRYPGSGVGGKGNMFLFGHSTSYKVVQNQAYKAFNNLGTLKKDNLIIVDSTNTRFVYKVDSVDLVNDSEALVRFDTNEDMITLSTCNTFGQKQERYVVKAYFLRSESLENATSTAKQSD